jgi:hypothetical protein
MGTVVNMSLRGWKKIHHKLFRCPTFWKLKYSFHCPRCGKGYRCYWDGNDVTGHGIDYCNSCASLLENMKADQLPTTNTKS